MVVTQKGRRGRKATGGRYRVAKGKPTVYRGNEPALTRIDAVKKRSFRMKGGGRKVRLFSTDVINVLDPKTKMHKVVKLVSVVDNVANRNYVRRNVLTKGAIVQTDAGKARVTNSPGQEGAVNGVLIVE